MAYRRYGTLYEEHPELMVYVVDIEETKKYGAHSAHKIICKCPQCGSEKPVIIENLSRNGFHCTVCSDGVSYPNKFVNSVLDQINVVHEQEKTFSWLSNKRYDQYLPDYSMIIENQGLQHYSDNDGHLFPYQTLKNVQEIDKYKKEIAKEHGIQHYIYIDCSLSTQDWMKEHIMNSELPEMLSFTENDIDWDLCDEMASTSKIKEAWRMWNNYIPTKEIAKVLSVAETTVRNYIHRGIDCGRCEPFIGATKETRKARRTALGYTNGQMKPIYCVTDDVYFASRFECGDYYSNIFPKTAAYQLYKKINDQKPYKGKLFVYISKEEFNHKLEESYTDRNIKIYGRPFLTKSA